VVTLTRVSEASGARPARGRHRARRFPGVRTLTGRASLNAIAGLIDYLAQIVVGLVVTPFLVRGLGSFTYGVWQVLQRLLGHAAVTTGRPGEALKWVIAHEQSSDDYAEKRRQVGSAIVVWFLFLPVLLSLGGLFSWFIPLWLHVPDSSVGSVRLASWLVVLTFVVISLAYLPQSVLAGENLGYKRIGLSAAVVVLGGGLTIAALALHTGIVGVAVAGLLTTFVTGAVYLYIVRSQVGWFGVARPRRSAVRRFLGLSGWFMLWNLVMQLMQGADVIVLGLAGSATLAAGYALTRYVPDAVTSVAAAVIFAVMPGLGGLIGAGERERAVGIRNEMMTITWLVTAAAGATILVWERCFLKLWVGPRYYPGMSTMLLIVIMVLQFAVIRTDSNIIDLTLVLRDKVLLGLLSACASVGLAVGAFVWLGAGIAGVVAGFIAGRMILTVAYPLLIGRLLEIAPRRQLLSALRPAAVTVLLFALAAYLGRAVDVSSWVSFAAGAVVTGAVCLAGAYLAGLPPAQRRRLRVRVRRVVRLA
jgi:O-antigen/teichoic acid export membrane protein